MNMKENISDNICKRKEENSLNSPTTTDVNNSLSIAGCSTGKRRT